MVLSMFYRQQESQGVRKLSVESQEVGARRQTVQNVVKGLRAQGLRVQYLRWAFDISELERLGTRYPSRPRELD
jgi:hypothetical protein